MSRYEDILQLPHHRSKKRAHMTRQDRAAQFAPFAALSGFEGEIAESARLTDSQAQLTEWAEAQVDEQLRKLQQEFSRKPEITLTYFVPDERKAGGAYHSVTARARKILEQERIRLLEDDIRVPIDRIVSLTVG